MDAIEKASFLANAIKKSRAVMQRAEEIGPSVKQTPRQPTMTENVELVSQIPQRPVEQPQPVRMKNAATTKMPREILQSFIDKPMIDPTAPFGHEAIMQEVTRAAAVDKMEQHYIEPKQMQEVVQKQTLSHQPQQMDLQLIEHIIKATVMTTIEQMQKLTTIDETIQIKIGDKIFGGKLTILKEVTKK